MSDNNKDGDGGVVAMVEEEEEASPQPDDVQQQQIVAAVAVAVAQASHSNLSATTVERGKRGGAASLVIAMNGNDAEETSSPPPPPAAPSLCGIGCTSHSAVRTNGGKAQPWVTAWYSQDTLKLQACLNTSTASSPSAIRPNAGVHKSLYCVSIASNMLDLALRQPNLAMLLVYSQYLDHQTGNDCIVRALNLISSRLGPLHDSTGWSRSLDLVMMLCIRQSDKNNAYGLYNFAAALLRTRTVPAKGCYTPLFWVEVQNIVLFDATIVAPEQSGPPLDAGKNRKIHKTWFWDVLVRCVRLLRSHGVMVQRHAYTQLISTASDMRHVFKLLFDCDDTFAATYSARLAHALGGVQ